MSPPQRAVLITGLGAMSCFGGGVDALWRGMNGPATLPCPVADPHARMALPLMYLVPPAAVSAEPAVLAGVRLGVGARLGVAAAEQAIADAGLDESTCRHVPVVAGVEMDNAGHHERCRSAGAADPRTPFMVTASAVAAAIGTSVGAVSVGNACAASGYALTVALDMIRAGEADAVLAGGAEGTSRVALGCFNRLGAVDPVRCRPFDRRRGGTIFGEGAAMLVLESEEHAMARGATPYAELSGATWSCDAHHLTAPDPDGAQVIRSMRGALAESRLAPEDIGAVVPHGTGTRLNDVAESQALLQVFGDRRPPMLSLKAMIGHTGSVAGAFACVAAALTLRAGRVPANVRLDEQDPDCMVWIPQDSPTPLTAPAVLVNAYAFGGNNVSLVVARRAEQRWTG